MTLATNPTLVSAALLSLGACAHSTQVPEVASAPPAPTEVTLSRGSVQVYDFGTLKLHAYKTDDLMADECFILETPSNLVAVEAPAFLDGIAVWKEYVQTLKKPLEAVLISSHPVGGRWFGNAKTFATATAKRAIEEGATKALSINLGQAFGEGFSKEIAPIDAVLANGRNTLGGVELVVTDDGDGYDIEIPAIGAIYTHMLGADSHSILMGTAHAQGFLAVLEKFKQRQFKLFLSGHHTPETPADLDVKIAYVRRIMELAAGSKTRDEFVGRAKAEFPAYSGLNYLEMSAGAFFPD